MKTLTNTVAGFAAVLLAALPVAVLSTAAHAQDLTGAYAHDSVHTGDLNLRSASGKGVFASRVDHVARRFCAGEHNLTLKGACQAGVRAEANEKAGDNIRLASRI